MNAAFAEAARWQREHPRLAAAALVLLVAIVYAPSLWNGFIWDDDGYVVHNRALRSVAGLRDLWLNADASPQYYPLVFTTFWIEQRLWGLAPAGYHATNAALHAAACVLLFRLLLRLTVPGAWLAAAVFAVHPVHVESVAWVTERKNVLSLVFALAALTLYLRAAPPEAPAGARPASWLRYGLALGLYVCALLSKTVTASVPAVVLVIDWWKRGRVTWRDAAFLLPFFAIGARLALVTIELERTQVGAVGVEWALSPYERVLIAGRVAWFYAGKLAWPHPLAFFYPRWRVDAGSYAALLYPAAGLLLVATLWLLRRRIGRGPLAAVLIFVGVLTPALGFFDVFPFRYSYVADHFQYHASGALIALAAAAASVGAQRLRRGAQRAAFGAALAAIAALGATAVRQVGHYRDLPTLYASVIAVDPGSWVAHNNLGRYRQNEGRHEEAIEHFAAALRTAPGYAVIRNNLATSLARLGRLDEAAAELERALDEPGGRYERADTRAALGTLRIRQERYAEAVELLRVALELRPRDPYTLYNLGAALGGAGDLRAGAEAVAESIALDPQDAMKHHELGALRRALGDRAGAVAAFSAAVRLAPGDAGYRTALGAALLESGDPPRARVELEAALRADPGRRDAAELLRTLETSR